eukprot:362907-Chlamydomonas_euryale.AAC.10
MLPNAPQRTKDKEAAEAATAPGKTHRGRHTAYGSAHRKWTAGTPWFGELQRLVNNAKQYEAMPKAMCGGVPCACWLPWGVRSLFGTGAACAGLPLQTCAHAHMLRAGARKVGGTKGGG